MFKIGDKVKTINKDIANQLNERDANEFTIQFFTNDKFGKRAYITGKNRAWMYEEIINLVMI